MDPLSITASIAAILKLSNDVLRYLTGIKDASIGRKQCTVELANLYSILLQLEFRREEGNASQCQPWNTAVRALAVENGPLDQFKEALEMLEGNLTNGGRLKQLSDVLVWKFKKEEVASILGRMERSKTQCEIALQMDHFKLTQAINSDVKSIRDEQELSRQRTILEWISPTNYPAQQSDILARRQKGTGQWFLVAPETARWLNEPKATLICPGMPGAGKTMIAAITIECLQVSMKSSSHGVAYVYCNYKEEQNSSSILTAILKQLVQGHSSAMKSAELLYQRHVDRGTRPSHDEILSALLDVLAYYPSVHIVVDALDECLYPTRCEFLAKLQALQAVHDIRIMTTSRFVHDIQDTFQDALKLEVRASNEDVERFVAGQINNLPRCVQRDVSLQKMVQAKIADAVDGITDQIRSRLTKGTTALDVAYRDALQRINDQLDGDRRLAQKVLSWIIFSRRSLTTSELCCALAVEPGGAKLDEERVYDIEDLISVCAGLVIVDQQSALIRLVHYTTQEYFERTRDAWNPGGELQIATTCLTYLSFLAFQSGSCSTAKQLEKRLEENRFLDYAAKNWGEHARAVEAMVADLTCTFLQSRLLSSSIQVSEGPDFRDQGCSSNYPKMGALHCTARFGLVTIADRILSTGEGYAEAVNTKDSWGKSPLCLAAEHGHGEMVKLLINKGANIDAQGGRYSSALHAASFAGHEVIVKLPLDRAAAVDARGGSYSNALKEASLEATR